MAYLILENGLCFEGQRIGAKKDSIGELVFTTGMVGYIETLTDASFAGQLVVQTFPLIGNYGVMEDDAEGKCAVGGYIVRELCDTPSNFRSQYELNKYLEDNGVCGLCGIDTRELVRVLREEGSMNAAICDEIPTDLSFIKEHTVKEIVKQVLCREPYTVAATGEKKFSVTVIDYGTRNSLIKTLAFLGCDVKVVPYNTSADVILNDNPDGIVLSSGTESVLKENDCIECVKNLLGKVPVLAIGTGHIIAALALGAEHEKLKNAHRGANIPVKEKSGTKTYITSQSHGYIVKRETLPENAHQVYINANDNSCEGIFYPDKNCLTVQFFPDTVIAQNNTSFIYNEFIKMMGGKNNA